jgi:diguanylate cyclase (GGDEF)-like protein
LIVPAARFPDSYPNAAPPCFGAAEQTYVGILEMIIRADPVENVMTAIVRAMAADPGIGGGAVLVLRDGGFEPIACCGISSRVLEHFRSAPVGDLLDEESLASRGASWRAVCGVEIRPLFSGAGEILGALAVPIATSSSPAAACNINVGTFESLAGFTIERDHLFAELKWRAEHDALTEMCNRHWFEERLASIAAEMRRTGAPFAVLCLNIDRFRLINDVLGYRVGNRLLREIAVRLNHHLTPGEEIARAGGNEFLLLNTHIARPDDVRAAGERLLRRFEEPFLVEGHELYVSASVGAAFLSGGDVAAEDIESRAYAAMACAKGRGRNQVVIFNPSMLRNSRERLEIGNRLRQALPNGELELHYQPQVKVATGEFTGVEALLRWKHDAIGFVSPETFIPVAEEAGLIATFGEWAIAQAFRQCALWKKEGLGPVRIAVNISPAHFAQEDFPRRFRALMAEAEPGCAIVELELTESVLIANLDRARAVMEDLAGTGAAFAIDDFGTGHSSLAYLQKLPIQRLKIPQTFIREISTAHDRPALAANIIRLARDLGVSSLAEGVETPEHAAALASMRCGEAQGYFYAKPLTAADFSQWLRARMPSENKNR